MALNLFLINGGDDHSAEIYASRKIPRREAKTSVLITLAINELNYDLAEQNTFVNQGFEYCVVCMFNRTRLSSWSGEGEQITH